MKTVIEMAREAGIDDPESHWLYWKAMERLAELVRADEREACAKTVEGFYGSRDEYAAAIRARSNT